MKEWMLKGSIPTASPGDDVPARVAGNDVAVFAEAETHHKLRSLHSLKTSIKTAFMNVNTLEQLELSFIEMGIFGYLERTRDPAQREWAPVQRPKRHVTFAARDHEVGHRGMKFTGKNGIRSALQVHAKIDTELN